MNNQQIKQQPIGASKYLFDRLPYHLFFVFCGYWLDSEDLCRLDSALCSKEFRPKFLEMLASDTFSTHGYLTTSRRSQQNYFKWLQLRNIHIRKLRLSPSTWQQNSQSLNQINLNSLHTFIAHTADSNWRERFNPSILINIIARSTSMVELILSSSSAADINDQTLETIATHCSHSLASLRLCDAAGVTLPSLRRIFSSCKHLTALGLGRCRFLNDELLSIIAANSPNLEEINLEGGEIVTDSSIINLVRHCSKLKIIEIGGCNLITDRSIYEISTQCSHLQKLDVSCQLLTDNSLQYLACTGRCSKIESLYISNAPNITNKGANYIGNSSFAKKLQCFIAYRTQITCKGIIRIFRGCSALKSIQTSVIDYKGHKNFLQIRDDNAASDRDFVEVLSYMPNLVTIGISNLTSLTDVSIFEIAQRYRFLKVISIGGFNVSDDGVIALASRCRKLQCVNLIECHKITDRSLKAIGMYCPQLSRIDLSGCNQITDDGLIHLTESCEGLMNLKVNRCQGISDFALLSVMDTCPFMNNHQATQVY